MKWLFAIGVCAALLVGILIGEKRGERECNATYMLIDP